MRNKLCVEFRTPDNNQNQLFWIHIITCFLTPNHIPNSKFRIWASTKYFGAIAYAQNPHLNVHVDVSSEARYLKFRYIKFVLILDLHPYFVYVKTKAVQQGCPDEQASLSLNLLLAGVIYTKICTGPYNIDK